MNGFGKVSGGRGKGFPEPGDEGFVLAGEDGAEVEVEGVVGGVADDGGGAGSQGGGKGLHSLRSSAVFNASGGGDPEGEGGDGGLGHGAAAGAGGGFDDVEGAGQFREGGDDFFGPLAEIFERGGEEGEGGGELIP